jgi:nitroimidazol reductase NimA-like FMN-containing flavoprotein (pyridoxamine 5'-phosphate oxidase superfamily)
MVTMEKENIEKIIRNASVCRLGILDGDTPYVVPLCFGYRDDTLYFHGSMKSGKYALIRKHPKVGFEFDILAETISAPDPCDWDMRYQSVIGFGTATMVEETAEKKQALEIIVSQYTNDPRPFTEQALRKTAVFKVAIETMTGRQSGVDPE